MQTSRQTLFTTIRTEGALLPADLLARIAEGDLSLPGLTPEAHHLPAGERINEATNRAWNHALGAWTTFKAATKRLVEGNPATTETRERWLLPLFQELGYGRLPAARAVERDGKSYPISHLWGQVPIHLVGSGIDLDRRTAGVAGAARTSPHSLVQELLNGSQEHLWGFVSNGLRLRILRDNANLTRQAYVEFDIEAMMEGEVYADFVLLWLLCHESRMGGERPEECWLEQWTRLASEQGTRALDQLRGGVEQAIVALGRGFLTHRANSTLREQLRTGTLDTQDYYRQLLRLVYRLIFLFVAEDRDLLLDPRATPDARACYFQYYSTVRLRRMAGRLRGTRHSDLFYGLRLVMEKLGDDRGCPELGLPALGSFLFSTGELGAIPALEGCEIANRDLLNAVRELTLTMDGNMRRVVDYKNLGSEELGSVYEALLELHPVLNVSAGTFALQTAGGNERKTTGSYYTPTSLINALLDSALNPVLEEASRQADPETAILNLKVCDPACGSGHFLIAAAHRMAKRLASVRTGDAEPAPEAVRAAVRDVVGCCIYGVDINPMAIELCKVGLWMEAVEPGKPLSFLEHHIQCGNALLGATPALLRGGIPDEAFDPIEGDEREVCGEFKKRNKEERKGRMQLFGYDIQPWEHVEDLASSVKGLADISDDTIAGVHQKQQQWEALMRSEKYLSNRLLADAWCAASVWGKTRQFAYPITDQVFRRIEQNTLDIAPWMLKEIQRLVEQYQFFHWFLVFPEVFHQASQDGQPHLDSPGWSGGFDVVLGNPPWEKLQTEELQFFTTRDPEIAALSGARRKAAIGMLAQTNPILAQQWRERRRMDAAVSKFIRNPGVYPLTGVGKFNTFALFAELNSKLISSKGQVGCIIPSGIATDDTTKFFFQHLMDTRTLVSLFDFENREGIFASVHRSFKFCLLTISGTARPVTRGAEFAFYAARLEDINDVAQRFTLSAQDLALLNPNTRTCPIFRSRRDAELTKMIYQNIPIFLNEADSSRNEYQPQVWRLINTTDDSSVFVDIERKLASDMSTIDSPLPVVEAKMIHQFDHRFATFRYDFDGSPEPYEVALSQKADPNYEVLARHYISDSQFRSRMPGELGDKQWFLTVRNIARATDERTVISTLIPRAAGCQDTPYIEIEGTAQTAAFLAGLFNSLILDYTARQKVGGTHLSYFIIYQLPVLPISKIQNFSLAFFTERVLELTYTSWSLEGFARDCSYNCPPFKWDEERRFLLRCELNAAYFHLYNIQLDDVNYILDTFPIMRRKEEGKYGEYRSKRVILEIYEAMRQAIETGMPYQTVLDPPPADSRICHPQLSRHLSGPGSQETDPLDGQNLQTVRAIFPSKKKDLPPS